MGEEENKPATRKDVLGLIDSFIEQIQQIRKILFGMSISAIVLAPLAIVLSVYLLVHPSFFAVLDTEDEFGFVLSILLGSVIMISAIWLVTGIKEYRSMSTWKGRYTQYMKEKEELDRKIASQFGLDQD
ncbi:MAG TPA: hypothetical protein VHK86_01295 [Nitrososphaera sp.]|jgi:uncharacterized membrane protein|nr:hypothetical protein [Nitrososphaera sp.]